MGGKDLNLNERLHANNGNLPAKDAKEKVSSQKGKDSSSKNDSILDSSLFAIGPIMAPTSLDLTHIGAPYQGEVFWR